MEERQLVKPQNHRLVINNRKTGTVTGVLDVLFFDLNETCLRQSRNADGKRHGHACKPAESLKRRSIWQAILTIFLIRHPFGKAGENLLSKLFR